MHQVRHAWNRLDLHANRSEAVDECPVDLRRRRIGDAGRVVLVEHEPGGDAALDRGLERAQHRRGRRLVQPQVIDGHVQCFDCAVEESGQALRDGVGGLPPIAQKVEVERAYRASALGSPVCSRGSSILTGSGRVAMAAASSGSSVSVISLRSSGAIAPEPRTCSSSQPNKPFQ